MCFHRQGLHFTSLSTATKKKFSSRCITHDKSLCWTKMPGRMSEKQLPTPPPDRRISDYSASNRNRVAGHQQQHNKASSQDSLVKRGFSGSSLASTGTKRTAYGSGLGSTNGTSKVDLNDDLSIRLLAHNAMNEVHQTHILTPDQVEDLKNVIPPLFSLTQGTSDIEIISRVDESQASSRTKSKTGSSIPSAPRRCNA